MRIAAFDVLFAAMPLMCFLCGCLRNPVLICCFAAMPLNCFLRGCLRNRASAWGMAGFDVP